MYHYERSHIHCRSMYGKHDSRLPNASHFGFVFFFFFVLFSFPPFSDLDHWRQTLRGILCNNYFSSMLLLYCYSIRLICIAVVVIVAVFRRVGMVKMGWRGERHGF